MKLTHDKKVNYTPAEKKEFIEKVKNKFLREPLTDIGNSNRFLYLFRKKILYNHTSKMFLIWDDKHWAEDNTLKVMDFAKQIPRWMMKIAEDISDDHKRRELINFANKTASNSSLQAMIELAKSDQTISINQDVLDQNQWLLNLQNGTFDLKRDRFRPHSRTDKITKICNFEFNSSAEAPLWNGFLRKIFNDNNRLIGYLSRAVGYSLTGDTSEQIFFILYGTGENGKSTFLNTIKLMLAGYSKQTPFDTILSGKVGQIRNDLAGLVNTRFVCAMEGDRDRKIAESVVKQITGGDTISVRKLYQEYFEYRPTYKLWLATNHKPLIEGTDHATWRRINLIPFTVKILKEERDVDLSKKLQREFPGIFNWALTGLKEWKKMRLEPPEEILKETNSYRAEMDYLINFIDERCNLNSDLSVATKDLYDSYLSWCSLNGETPVTKKGFGTRLREKGLEAIRMKDSSRGWKGIGLK